MRSMIISVKSSFHNTPVQSVLKNKNQSLSRCVVQTLLATIVLLDDHSFGVRSLKSTKSNELLSKIYAEKTGLSVRNSVGIPIYLMDIK